MSHLQHRTRACLSQVVLGRRGLQAVLRLHGHTAGARRGPPTCHPRGPRPPLSAPAHGTVSGSHLIQYLSPLCPPTGLTQPLTTERGEPLSASPQCTP
eukprot:703754-Rhodomonas_salina.4